jgi:hypothetical protein
MAIISIPTSIGGVSLPGQVGQLASGPLAALFGSSKSTTILNYPTELSTDATKSHYVQFTIKDIVPGGWEKGTPETNITAPGAGNLVQSAGQNLQNVAQGAASSAVQSAGNLLGSVTNLAATALDTGLKVKPTVQNNGAYISLYMPDTLQANYDAHYQRIDLRNELGPIINNIRGIGELADNGLLSSKSFKDVVGSFSSDPYGIDKLSQLVSKGLLGSKDLGNVLLQGQGYAVNPQMQMIYQGLDMRTFQLEFLFTPKSQAEALNVNEIIYQFKRAASPTLAKATESATQNMYLIPPSIFNVNFFVKGVENKYLPRYGDCVLENISVDFAPNGWAAHANGGAPVQTRMSLQFREIEVVDRARLDEGFKNSAATQTGLR